MPAFRHKRPILILEPPAGLVLHPFSRGVAGLLKLCRHRRVHVDRSGCGPGSLVLPVHLAHRPHLHRVAGGLGHQVAELGAGDVHRLRTPDHRGVADQANLIVSGALHRIPGGQPVLAELYRLQLVHPPRHGRQIHGDLQDGGIHAGWLDRLHIGGPVQVDVRVLQGKIISVLRVEIHLNLRHILRRPVKTHVSEIDLTHVVLVALRLNLHLGRLYIVPDAHLRLHIQADGGDLLAALRHGRKRRAHSQHPGQHQGLQSLPMILCHKHLLLPLSRALLPSTLKPRGHKVNSTF